MKRTKLFFDTEFTGLHKNTTLISIGIVSECGKSFYAELTDYDKSQVDTWLQENVINNLLSNNISEDDSIKYDVDWKDVNETMAWNGFSFEAKLNKQFLKEELKRWLSQFESVEMWSDCLAYDWVLFCDIFGTAFDIPSNVYYLPFDLVSFLHLRGYDPDISREDFADGYIDIDSNTKIVKHNALWDAYVIKGCYNRLCNEKK